MTSALDQSIFQKLHLNDLNFKIAP